MATLPPTPPPLGRVAFGALVGSAVYLSTTAQQFLQQLWTAATALTPATGVFTTATLPAPASALAGPGARAFVTDSNVTAVGNFGAAYTGGGAHAAPLWTDGTTWFIG